MEVVTKAGVCTRSMYMDYDDEAVFRARRFLFDHAREHSNQPFLLTVSMIQPHDPYLCSQQHWDRYREDDIDLPRVPLGTVTEDPHSARLRFSYGASDVELSDDMIRQARHAYYGAIADIDDKVGELLATLQEAGFADNTIIVFTSDHGDMLGERGMWFKMSYLENSARVPLIVHAPKMFSAARVSSAVSLVDLLPTFAELANDAKAVDYATEIEGRSLLTCLQGGIGHDEAIGEYFGEGTVAPLFMLRRKDKKLIYSSRDPLQYYDLGSDPLELNNLAEADDHREQAIALVSEIKGSYDEAALTARVLESQRRRNFLKSVMLKQQVAWDYQPPENADTSWIRNSMPIYQLEKKARFPQV